MSLCAADGPWDVKGGTDEVVYDSTDIVILPQYNIHDVDVHLICLVISVLPSCSFTR